MIDQMKNVSTSLSRVRFSSTEDDTDSGYESITSLLVSAEGDSEDVAVLLPILDSLEA